MMILADRGGRMPRRAIPILSPRATGNAARWTSLALAWTNNQLAQNKAFASRLRELGADAQIDLYGPGTHNRVYWQRELHKAWPMITASLR
jgi:S-formylglutathione hydrolase FrmB